MYSNGIMNTYPFYSLNPFALNYRVLTFEKKKIWGVLLFCFPLLFYNSLPLKFYQTAYKQCRSPWVPYLEYEINKKTDVCVCVLILVNIECIFLWLLRWNGVYPNLPEIWYNSRNRTQVLEKSPLWPGAVLECGSC